ncbi:hypothetical protein MUY27_20160 [Mucilaginibacter sp. RS28]|uniref:Uncharacterized protein n=1 Tax=Mucilaginibacter straminoryzae TaxID=2932774 RepID=A0A9X2BDF6_9SPHI|nr:hypothetical protein [Mucilaginibacter straminoryzae]MCJ8212042.1 hypothetical protein [Mucilaginibacter straminoryzae]
MLFRAVHWVLFPFGLLLLVSLHYLQEGKISTMLYAVVFNVLFLLVQFLLVSVYFSLKHKQWVNLTRGMFNWGDIFFILVVACYLSTVNFIAFYISSLLVSLLAWLLVVRRYARNKNHIPLAGLQALFFVVLFAFSWIKPAFKLTDDSYLLNLLQP